MARFTIFILCLIVDLCFMLQQSTAVPVRISLNRYEDATEGLSFGDGVRLREHIPVRPEPTYAELLLAVRKQKALMSINSGIPASNLTTVFYSGLPRSKGEEDKAFAQHEVGDWSEKNIGKDRYFWYEDASGGEIGDELDVGLDYYYPDNAEDVVDHYEKALSRAMGEDANGEVLLVLGEGKMKPDPNSAFMR